MKTPQNEILDYYLTGKPITVNRARELFGTTELRRVNSRLKSELLLRGYSLVGRKMGIDKYKTYWIKKI
jgi:hypothetical protein